jgi:carbon monoxide dehydrogenase subunit G
MMSESGQQIRAADAISRIWPDKEKDMATIRKIIDLDAPLAKIWAALADFQNVHTRVAPGFVSTSVPDGSARILTFSNGSTAREQLVTMDETQHRLVYAIKEGKAAHHNASVDLIEQAPQKTRFVWTTDILPDELAGYIDAQMTEATKAMKPALER